MSLPLAALQMFLLCFTSLSSSDNEQQWVCKRGEDSDFGSKEIIFINYLNSFKNSIH